MKTKLMIVGLLIGMLFTTSAVCSAAINVGTLVAASIRSKVLGENITFNVYLPYGYEGGESSYPVLYLLHGRGNDKNAWKKVQSDIDELIATHQVKPFIAVMPDAPWSDRGSYYVDSAYKTGKAVETALITELIPAIDETYRSIRTRDNRIIGGYSMGGYGAIRYLLNYPQLFGGGIVLSPAVYYPLPPADSSTREFGAFGKNDTLFVDDIWLAKNYPVTLKVLESSGLKANVYIAVGDDEYAIPDINERLHDLDVEAHMFYNLARRSKAIHAEFRVMQGGHGWEVWRPAFIDALKFLLKPKEQTK